MPIDIELSVNGRRHTVSVTTTDMLLTVLRDKLGYTGTNRDCGQGICGCCTVLLNGDPVTSCILLAAQANDAQIMTVEGLAREGKLHPLQDAFLHHGAVQCGYCTPGFLMVAKALLDENPSPSREEIIDALAGNLCRCTGYVKIVDAIADVARGEHTD